MVKVKEETTVGMAEPKPSTTTTTSAMSTSPHNNNTNNNNNHTTASSRKSLSRHNNHHYPSYFHHSYSYHHCTFPQPAPVPQQPPPTASSGDPAPAADVNGATPARFYFGPGFERQSSSFNAGPSQQAQNGSEYVVFFHVNPGVTISFQMGESLEVLRGPVTVPMVSTNSSPPIAMPVQVPPGHIVQQIVDESGTLRHVILSPQHTAGLLPITSHNPPHYGAGPPNGTNPPPYHYPQGLPPGFPAPHHHHFPSNMPPGAHPLPTHPPGHSPPPGYYKDERTQRQYFKLKKKLHDKQQKGVMCESVNCERKDLVNGLKRVKEKGMNSVGTSEDGEESSSVQDEEDSVHIITEMLSSVQAPKVSELSSRSALLQWAAPLRLSEASSNDSHELDIPENDLRYEVLLSDKSKEMKYKSIYSGASLSCRIQDLRPGLEYSVCLQVHLDELQGTASDPLKFTTPPCEPDQPQPPKLISRTKNSLQLRWSATLANGSSINYYILEYDEGKGGDFVELHKTKGHQHTLQKLTPATCYKFRLSAVNDCGKSMHSDVVTHYTSDNAPLQPNRPHLEKATINSLHLSWQRRPKDDEFTLQIDGDRYGFMNAYNGRDTEHICYNLKRYTNYKFRLRAQNDGGYSPWSDEITFQTLPDKPKKPSKPTVKGKIHAHSFKLKWEPPSDTGGAEISKYILEVLRGSGYDVVYTGEETEAICDKLTPGTTYQLRVSCESIGGRSNYSDPCTVTTDAICPGQCPIPRLHGKPKANSLMLRFTGPDYNGGAPVLEYEVEMVSPDDKRSLVHKSKENECAVENLQPGCEYVFTVRAVNRVGAGAWSEPLTITSGAAAPDAPSAPTLTCKTPSQIYAEWQEPATNGARISEYRLELSTSDNHDQFQSIYQGSSTSYDIKNLNPFTTYYVRVQASNIAGYGPYSSISPTVTPAAPPNHVHSPKYETTPRSIKLFWSDPIDNGSPITHYIIEIGDKVINTESKINEYTIESLQPETVYRIKIQAVNLVGAGAYSSTLRITTLKLPPAPPKVECTGSGHNYLKLKWGEGRNVEFTQFCVEMQNIRNREYQIVFKGTAYTCKVNKLQEMTTYKFRICASNDAGEGDYSNDFEFTTSIAPPTAIKSIKVSDIDQKHCLVEWLPLRNPSNDAILYSVQICRLKDQQYKQIYKGSETKCTADHLDSGAEYNVRICRIRQTQNGDLVGPYSTPTSFTTLPQEPTTLGKVTSLNTSTPTHSNKTKNLLQTIWPQNKTMTVLQEAFLKTIVILLIGIVLSVIIWYINL